MTAATEQPQPAKIDLNTGKLAFGNPETGEIINLDLMILQLTIERVESMHRLPTLAGFPTSTPEFLQALAIEVERLGIVGCTPTQAFQIWNVSAAAISALKKNTRQSVRSVSGLTSTPEPSPPVSELATKPTSEESKPSPESTKA